MMNTPEKTTVGRALLATMALAMVTACSDSTASEPEAQPEGVPTVEVTALDYEFADLPETIEAGTKLTLVNESSNELHELVAIRLPEDETRSIDDLVADPEALASYFPSVTTVLIAPPEEGGIAVEGTGVLEEPGRYAIICAIPTGADPDEYMAAAAEAEGGPPEVEGGPPHFVVGMYAEVTVEE